MKIPKMIIIALVAVLSFASARAQVSIHARIGSRPVYHHRRVVVVHRRPVYHRYYHRYYHRRWSHPVYRRHYYRRHY